MIDRYLKFPLPEDSCLSNFSSQVAIDQKHRIAFPSQVKKVFSQRVFDILSFPEQEIPYMQIVPHNFYTDSYKSFLDSWQKWLFDKDYIAHWLDAFEEYCVRANTFTLDGSDRLNISSSIAQKFSLQSEQKMHMVILYPYIKIYKIKDYNSLLQQYAHPKK
jgi:DNA-binding transcriptional regulator/RsmH inhibitor MraZ